MCDLKRKKPGNGLSANLWVTGKMCTGAHKIGPDAENCFETKRKIKYKERERRHEKDNAPNSINAGEIRSPYFQVECGEGRGRDKKSVTKKELSGEKEYSRVTPKLR